METTRKRRWWQFSLRDMLWLMIVVGSLLGGWVAGWNAGWRDAAQPVRRGGPNYLQPLDRE